MARTSRQKRPAGENKTPLDVEYAKRPKRVKRIKLEGSDLDVVVNETPPDAKHGKRVKLEGSHLDDVKGVCTCFFFTTEIAD